MLDLARTVLTQIVGPSFIPRKCNKSFDLVAKLHTTLENPVFALLLNSNPQVESNPFYTAYLTALIPPGWVGARDKKREL